MSGLPIIFRAIDIGFSEPTVIYQCVEVDGKWELREEIRFKQADLNTIRSYLADHAIAPHKKVIIADGYPQIEHELKMKGIRAKS